jgi:hypothetical protein
MSCVLRFGEYYIEWSSIFNRFTYVGLKRSEFEAWYMKEYGRACADRLPPILARADQGGTSHRFKTLEDTLSNNRAGLDGAWLTARQIYDHYCVGCAVGFPPMGRQWSDYDEENPWVDDTLSEDGKGLREQGGAIEQAQP